ncbi:hypothetical protein [Methylobacter sp. S3L5C]|uniref:hypothetical protein n=1 Tax=Methylobacter sp. S3L5C TaxID=2839024 RepID=UPI001FAC8FD2|nr:hypothetical protein [Methylobacter sp. S3L5C]UOA07347.1 hypothetical protein KKZ03_13795 [Methylobacter sp. S3L5C]
MADNTAQEKIVRPAISRPVFERSIKIQSEQAIRVIRRSYGRLIRSLYAIDVILRIVGQEQAIDDVEDVVSKMISDCAEQLQQEKARLDKLCTDNGIAEAPGYTHPADFKARITSPQIAQFVELIRLLDQLMIAMDTLWLCQILTSKQCSVARYQWQQRLHRLARRIILIEQRAHQAAYAQGRGEEIRLAREESGLMAEPEFIKENDNEGSGFEEKADEN